MDRELVCAASDGVPAVLMDYPGEHPADAFQILLNTVNEK